MIDDAGSKENPSKVPIEGGTNAQFAVASSADGGRIEPALSRRHGQLETIRSADLVEHAGEMMLHGLFADRALLRNFFVRAAGNDEIQDLALAAGQLPRRRGIGRLKQWTNGFEEMR